MTFLSELCEYLCKREIRLFTLVEQKCGSLALLWVELHVLHEFFGQCDFLAGNLAVRFGDVTEDGEGRGKKRSLGALLSATLYSAGTGVNVMSEGRADQRAQRPADHESECTANQLAPPGHRHVPVLLE